MAEGDETAARAWGETDGDLFDLPVPLAVGAICRGEDDLVAGLGETYAPVTGALSLATPVRGHLDRLALVDFLRTVREEDRVLVVLSPQVGGLSQGLSNMADYMKAHEMAPLPGKSAVALVSTLLMTSFGTWGLPQMVHKYYGILDGKEVKRGTIISTFFALLVAGGGYFIGSLSHLFFG